MTMWLYNRQAENAPADESPNPKDQDGNPNKADDDDDRNEAMDNIDNAVEWTMDEKDDVNPPTVTDQGPPKMVQQQDVFEDHYTLPIPSSHVRFRGTSVQVYEARTSQWQIHQRTTEERSSSDHENNGSIAFQVKHVSSDKTTGLNLLRLAYTLIAFFYVGFLFVVCFQVVLFIFMDLVVEAGLTDTSKGNPGAFIGTLCAI